MPQQERTEELLILVIWIKENFKIISAFLALSFRVDSVGMCKVN